MEGREKEKERNIEVRETSISCFPYAPRTKPTTQVCALTRQPSSLRDDAQPMEPHQPGLCQSLYYLAEEETAGFSYELPYLLCYKRL